MIEAYLRNGNDVVFPQMLVDPAELAKFEAAAANADADFVERMLMDTAAASVARFHLRGSAEPDDSWHHEVRTIVAAEGGDEMLAKVYAGLTDLLTERPRAVVVESREGDLEHTYRTLVETLR